MKVCFDVNNIIYEDNHLLIVKKPCNIPVQADASKDKDLLSIIKEYLKVVYNKPGNVFLGLVHRLDRPVGGIMVFAKTSKAASRLSEQIRNRSFKKIYLAVVHGVLKNKQGNLKDYLYKDRKTNTVHITGADKKGSKLAELDYKVLETSGNLSLVRINLKTGRNHQIRVQFKNLGHPLYGDQKYGRELNRPGQQIALWSYELGIVHPTQKKELVFCCNPPLAYPWESFKEIQRDSSIINK